MLLKSLDADVAVSHARSAKECLSAARIGAIDLVFLDLGLPDLPGLDALSELKSVRPDLPVVVLSGREECEVVEEAIKRGAMGFIPKSTEDPQLLSRALKTALSGAVTVPDTRGRHGAASDAKPLDVNDLGLTARRLDVLRLLVQGMPNKSIARRLDIAETTARGYVSELLAAFRVTNRTQLVFEVARRGLRLGVGEPPITKE